MTFELALPLWESFEISYSNQLPWRQTKGMENSAVPSRRPLQGAHDKSSSSSPWRISFKGGIETVPKIRQTKHSVINE